MRHQLRPPGTRKKCVAWETEKKNKKKKMRTDGRFDMTSGGEKEGAVAYRLLSVTRETREHQRTAKEERKETTLPATVGRPTPDGRESRHTGIDTKQRD